MSIKTGVIGCGKVGHFHAKAYAQLPGSEFVGACNHNIKRAEEYAKTYSVQPFDSVGEMIDRTGIELVSICTPHLAHAKDAVEAIEHGAHVMIEKPLAITLRDCDLILNAAEKHNRQVAVTCQRRFYPPCLRIKQAIDDGKIGRPIIASVTMLGWRDMAYYASDPWRGSWDQEGGGVLVNQAPHQLDLLLWYMGEIDEISAIWDTLNHPNLEVEDTAAAVIRFKNGAIGSILVTNSVNPALYGKVHVHGENGATLGVQTDGGAMFIAGMSGIAEPPVNDLWTVPGEEGLLAQWKDEDSKMFHSVDNMYYFHRMQIQDFIEAIGQNRPPLVDGLAGRRTVELFTAIYVSGRTHKSIKFPIL